MDAPRLASPRMPRHNALSPLQAFSPLREEAALPPVPRRPPAKTSAAPPAAARSRSVSTADLPSDRGRLRRSLTGRERAFSFAKSRGAPHAHARHDAAAGITTRLLLVKAPNNDGLHR